jgi:BlaI family penicillinase repressor
MARLPQEGLTARESQIINVLWKCGEATVEEIRAQLSEDLAGSTLRTLLNIMQEKGYVAFYKKGKAKVFRPLAAREEVQTSALRTLKQRLFQGSAPQLLARLVENEEISLEELDALRQKVKDQQTEGGQP